MHFLEVPDGLEVLHFKFQVSRIIIIIKVFIWRMLDASIDNNAYNNNTKRGLEHDDRLLDWKTSQQ